MSELNMVFVHEPQLPPMAWLATIKGPLAMVRHGSRVEVWENGFFEGAYAGRWIDDDPSQCADVFGSGIVVRDGAFHIVTPSHTLEALFVCQHDGTTTVSNSLAFLIERTGLAVPIDYHYAKRFTTVMRGVRAYERRIIRSGKGCIDRWMFQNLRITADGLIRPSDKPVGSGVSTYEAYIGHLEAVLRAVSDNAVDRRRMHDYVLASTISSGYDSAFVTAVASQVGLDEAFSVRLGRNGLDDSGKQVAAHFGVKTTVVSPRSHAGASLAELAEFGVSGLGLEDFAYAAFTPFIVGRVLLIGNPAAVWQLLAEPNSVLVRHDCSSTTLQEHRLRMGFVQVPVPAIALNSHTRLYRLAASEELAPYRLPGNYNAPIPRRYLETHGVPRNMFGRKKQAISLLFFNRSGGRSHLRFRNHQLSEAVRDETVTRARSLGIDPFGLEYRRHAAWWVMKRLALRRSEVAITAVRNATSRPSIVRRVISSIDRRIHDSAHLHDLIPPIQSLIFIVSLDIVRERYRTPNLMSNSSATVDS